MIRLRRERVSQPLPAGVRPPWWPKPKPGEQCSVIATTADTEFWRIIETERWH